MPVRVRQLLPLAAATVAASVTLAVAASADDGCATSGCRADVDISGHAEPQPIYSGQSSEFKFTAKNDGPAGTHSVELQATIPAGLTIKYVHTYNAPGCSPKGQFVDCFLGDMVREQEAVVRIGVTGTKLNTYLAPAKVYSYGDDPNGGNNQVTASLKIKAGRPPGSSAPASSSGSMHLADPQKVLSTGGVKATVRAPATGTMKVSGVVKTSSGGVALVSVTKKVKAGSLVSIFLGTTPGAQAKLRSALSGGAKLTAAVTAKVGSRSLRATTHVSR